MHAFGFAQELDSAPANEGCAREVIFLRFLYTPSLHFDPSKGVEYGEECFCSNSKKKFKRKGRLTSADCDMECPGDPNVSCGGRDAIEVFRIGDLGQDKETSTSRCEVAFSDGSLSFFLFPMHGVGLLSIMSEPSYGLCAVQRLATPHYPVEARTERSGRRSEQFRGDNDLHLKHERALPEGVQST